MSSASNAYSAKYYSRRALATWIREEKREEKTEITVEEDRSRRGGGENGSYRQETRRQRSGKTVEGGSCVDMADGRDQIQETHQA